MPFLKTLVMLLLVTSSCLHAAAEQNQQSAKTTSNTGFWKSVYNFFLPHTEERMILYQGETRYYNVSVEVGTKKRRHLVFKPTKGSQGIWDPKHPHQLVSNYLRTAATALTSFDTPPKNVLFIGLGGGLLPMFLRHHFPDMQIDIVEIDDGIPKIAEQYFGFKIDKRMQLIIADGRVFMNHCQDKYDMIFLDAYNAEAIPFHLTTKEFFEKISESLSPNGVASINIANLGKSAFISSELYTIQTVFKHMAVYTCPNNSNYVPLVSNQNPLNADEMLKRAEILQASFKGSGFRLSAYLASRLSPEALKDLIGPKPQLLTDDFSPVNILD